ncbi:sensor histidine kinase [Microbacterium sp. NIBRBAC000506063]|uniref:sensor histidine kinase n=1 Tax=Microbacterium sp. NIBRBAC000506063 TaxID=2734618 RepID=UPI0021D447F5|nr:histidine kinase [Microbacterium sp. NIBRBAC000506063]
MSALARPFTARDQRIDAAVAAAILVGTVLSAALSSISEIYGDEAAPLWQALLYAVLISAPLAVRRRWPGIVAVIVSGGYFVAVTLKIPEIVVGNIAMFIALYTVGAWMPNRRRAAGVRIGIIIGMFTWLIVTMYRDAIAYADDAEVMSGTLSPFMAFMLLQILLNLLYFGGAYYFGEREWTAARQRAALEQRTADLERERELTAAQAVALDRVRIARELHDVVAHHVSVMGVQAGAARTVFDQDPPRPSRCSYPSSRPRARRSPSCGTCWRRCASTTAARPLDAVARRHPEAGRRLPPGGPAHRFHRRRHAGRCARVVAVTIYRITQESLTNARRHAGAHVAADVRLRYAEGSVEVEVTNSGRLIAEPRPGLGMLGMRERTIAAGGVIEIGPREKGGFRVRASFPVSDAAELTEAAR